MHRLPTASPPASTVVLITGCSSGIGRALAEEFNHRGYRVYATARELSAIEDLAAKQIKIARLDVTDEPEIAEAVHHILTQESHIDILVNNAGYGAMGPLLDISKAALQRQFETNVFGLMSLVHQVTPAMIDQGGGVIVNIGSISGIFPTPFSGAYCASKSAVHTLSDVLRVELAPFNIDVITVQPGAIQSNFGNAATEQLEGILKPDSVYGELEEGIRDRANLSQLNALSTEAFAKILVTHMQNGRSRKPILRIGKQSILLPFLKRWLPVRWLDQLLIKRFRLDRLRGKRKSNDQF